MTRNQIPNPLLWLLTHLSLQLDLENSVGELGPVFLGDVVKGRVDPDVGPSPVAVRSVAAVKVVLSDHGELGVEGDSDTGVSGELEGGSVVEGSHDWMERRRVRKEDIVSVRTRRGADLGMAIKTDLA
jgi:hypothetical protein